MYTKLFKKFITVVINLFFKFDESKINSMPRNGCEFAFAGLSPANAKNISLCVLCASAVKKTFKAKHTFSKF